MMRRKKILEKVKATVLGFDPGARVFLYGSRARGDHKRLSDWDFFVMTSFDFDDKKKRQLRDELYMTELESEQIISSVIDSREFFERFSATMPLFVNILKEGIEI